MRDQDDRGMALIAVIGLGMVMMILIATGLTTAVSGLRQADSDQDSSGALDAAYAGVQDYLARVNLNSNYVQYGNSSAAFSSTSTLTALASNPAFGVGTSGTWAAVPGSGGNSTFRYEVDNSTFASSGVLRLRATGRVGVTTRSIVASFRVRGFIDYTYFTDYEIQDPQISGVDPAVCVKHAWEGRSSSCPTIQFGTFDSLNGRVHSNDTMVICGATFTGTVTTANPNTPVYSTTGCGTIKPATVTVAAQLPMPATNTTMRTDAKCLYTGPTQITYNNDATANTPGTMTVVSPWTKFTNVNGVPSNPPACGSIAALHSTAGATVNQLDADALYVQNVPPSTSTGDPNYWDPSLTPGGVTCLGATGASTTSGSGAGWQYTTNGTTIRYPLTNENPAVGWQNTSVSPTQWSTATPAYGCRSGDLYVQGTVSVATTAGSENYVYITGDLKYADKTQDILGLVGQNAVLVWNPVNSGGASLIGGTNREVDAALISVAHTFQVQNYSVGSNRGTLTVFGSIAQKFRGPVATTTNGTSIATGYMKSYSYDPLLGVVSPPKYLSPAAVSFTLQRYASVPAAFSSTGVAQ